MIYRPTARSDPRREPDTETGGLPGRTDERISVDRLEEIKGRLAKDWPEMMFSGHVKPDMEWMASRIENLEHEVEEKNDYITCLEDEVQEKVG